MSLLSDFDDLVRDYTQDFKEELRNDCKRHLSEGIDIFRGFVPIDLEILKQTIKGEIFETESGFEIRIWVQDRIIHDNISSQWLGVRLERGRGYVRGRSRQVQLTRTRNNTYASKGETTADWFQKAYEFWCQKIGL